MIWIHAWWWLENNNFWKSTVAWSVGLLLNSAWAVRLWLLDRRVKKQRHDQLLDKLDVTTPGGIADLAKIIRGEEVEEPDDNGSDPPVRQHKRGGPDSGHSLPIRGGMPGGPSHH